VAAAKKYVALAGGPEALLGQAQQAYDEGDYSWAAELGKHLVYADRDHQAVVTRYQTVRHDLGTKGSGAAARCSSHR
jgi:alkyl sulfatase BDS1-like metallo-beta-lactamase superfamily hydrolase